MNKHGTTTIKILKVLEELEIIFQRNSETTWPIPRRMTEILNRLSYRKQQEKYQEVVNQDSMRQSK
ncbi:1030_t:CDS:2 [Gigaspora margarita]|uniref:1030_t:CDS:1 n=1 Tax=Gigaspora margarita TaxID=4874 RepID=A0ABN7UQK4_GIGMA|nr:1030_t:CDS:2 [Gigaspora margarita]